MSVGRQIEAHIQYSAFKRTVNVPVFPLLSIKIIEISIIQKLNYLIGKKWRVKLKEKVLNKT